MSKKKAAPPAGAITRDTHLADLLTGSGYDTDSTVRSLDCAGYRTVADLLAKAARWKGPVGRRVYDVLRDVAGVSTGAAIEIGDVIIDHDLLNAPEAK